MIFIQTEDTNNAYVTGGIFDDLIIQRYLNRIKKTSILKDMIDSPVTFYLTGSRLFGNARVDSDYDFFTAGKEAQKFLENDSGFGKIGTKDHGYIDDSIIDVFEFETDGQKIQIQLLRNTEMLDQKKQVQEIFLSTGFGIILQTYCEFVDKDGKKNEKESRRRRSFLWNEMMRLVMQQNKCMNYLLSKQNN